jgi:hypothetical protein
MLSSELFTTVFSLKIVRNFDYIDLSVPCASAFDSNDTKLVNSLVKIVNASIRSSRLFIYRIFLRA